MMLGLGLLLNHASFMFKCWILIVLNEILWSLALTMNIKMFMLIYIT